MVIKGLPMRITGKAITRAVVDTEAMNTPSDDIIKIHHTVNGT